MSETFEQEVLRRLTALERQVFDEPACIATLSPYVDPAMRLGWASHSHWWTPERSYLDTWPVERLRAALGINFNVTDAQVAKTAALLGTVGIRRARLGIGFGSCDFVDPTKLAALQQKSFAAKIAALAANDIRPCVVLDANPAAPCPAKAINLTLTAEAKIGATAVKIDAASAKLVAPGRTGFGSQGIMAHHLITSVAPDGTATLSRPLLESLPAGKTRNGLVYTLAFEPFGAEGSDDYKTTLSGWLGYVRAVASEIKKILGTEDFDIEVWNEAVGNNTAFLNINSYYSPAIEGGSTQQGVLSSTIELLRTSFPGVKYGNGFSNTSQHGVSVLGSAVDKHPYREEARYPAEESLSRYTLNALGESEGNPPPPGTFTPHYVARLPEFHLTGIGEFPTIYDLAPYNTSPNPQKSQEWHGRNQGPGWITEYGLPTTDRTEQAKMALRAYVAFVGAGAEAVHLFAAAYSTYALIDPVYFTGGGPGLTMEALGRFAAALEGEEITQPQELIPESVGAFEEGIQFAGDGTRMHPDLRDLDVVRFRPFQTGDGKFLAAVYIETRNLAEPHPGATFRFGLSGIKDASLYDPLTGETLPAVIRSDGVDVELTDYPRLLSISV